MSRRLLLVAGAGGSFTAPESPPVTLSPTATIGIARSGSNPTFNFNSLVENVILVSGTYWAAYQPGQEGSIALASASSPDGPWTAQGTKVTASKIYAPYLVEDAGTFYLFYADDKGVGGDGKMYYASSSTVNGTYTPNVSSILDPGTAGAWDDYRVSEQCILKSGSTYHMLYMAEKTAYQTTEQVGHATASAITGPWTKDSGNPVLAPGTSGEWDDFMTADPDMFEYGGYFWMWYTGLPGPSSSDVPWGIGLAYATDPAGPWTRHPSNPIITGSGSGFDQNGTFRGGVVVDGDDFHVTYTGMPSGSPDLATMKGGNAVLVIT